MLFKMLCESGTKLAILSLIPGLIQNFKKCEAVELVVTPDMAHSVENETKQLNQSNIWYQYIFGLITASKMKAVCHTNAACPSQSMIKQIRYLKSFVFQSKQTTWGCSHE